MVWATQEAQYYWAVIVGYDMSLHARMQEACAVAMVDGVYSGLFISVALLTL